MSFVESLLDRIENILNCKIEIAHLQLLSAKDSVRFAGPCLPVGEKGGIMSLKDSFYEVAAALVDIFLFAWVHDVIEPEYFFLIIFPLDIDGGGIGLEDRIKYTSSISSISGSL